eukprot:2871165-Prymnesium_polylepis.1
MAAFFCASFWARSRRRTSGSFGSPNGSAPIMPPANRRVQERPRVRSGAVVRDHAPPREITRNIVKSCALS